MTKTGIRNQPAYSVAEAARYLKVAPATLRSWVVGRPYPKGAGTAHSSPLIRPPKSPPQRCLFGTSLKRMFCALCVPTIV